MSTSFSTLQQKIRAQPIAATGAKLRDALKFIPPTTATVLGNQVRVVAEENPLAAIATVGLWIEAGTKTEDREINGVTKALLSAGFKGTEKRTRADLAKQLEQIGGRVSVNVGREHSYLMMQVQKKHVGKAVEIMSDIALNGKLADEDVAATKKEMIQAYSESQELIDEQTMDFLHVCAYDATQGGGLGNSVFGTAEGFNALDAPALRNYRNTHFTGPRMMLVGTGGVNQTELDQLAQTYLGSLQSSNNKPSTRTRYVGGDIRHHQPRMKTGHVAWAVETCGRHCADTVPIQLFSNMHGGWDRHQAEMGLMPVHRMMTIYGAHDHGPTHWHMLPREAMESLKTFHCSYEDSGLFGSYLVGRPYKSGPNQAIAFADMLEVQIREVTRLVAKAIHEQELDQAKVNYKSQLLMDMDGATNSAIDAATQHFHFGRRVPIAEMYDRIDDITATNVQEVMNHYYTARNPVFALNGNFNPIPGYDCMARWTNHPLWHMSL